jgi:hypothetical protein
MLHESIRDGMPEICLCRTSHILYSSQRTYGGKCLHPNIGYRTLAPSRSSADYEYLTITLDVAQTVKHSVNEADFPSNVVWRLSTSSWIGSRLDDGSIGEHQRPGGGQHSL